MSLQRKEMANDLEGPYRKTLSPDNLSAFSWDKTTSWAEEKAPLTVACLRSMFPPAKKIQKQIVNYSPGNKPRWVKQENLRISFYKALHRNSMRMINVTQYFVVSGG